MRTPDLKQEQGIALVIAILAMVVIAGLLSATFTAGRMELMSGRNTIYTAQAFEAGESGLAAALSNWQPTVYNQLASGASVTLPVVSVGSYASYQVAISRLNDNLFLIRSSGFRNDAAGNRLATRTVASTSRLLVPNIDMNAALTVNGTVGLGGSAEVNGVDDIPSGWGSCPMVTDTVPGIRSSTNNVITTGANCASLNCVTGDPQFVGNDTTITSQTFTDFNGITFADMAAMATWNVSGTLTGIAPSLTMTGSCDQSTFMNWGEPYGGTGFGACFDYFPIIYAPGDLHLSGGRGQGILLVEGDLTLAGGVEFFGPVIVQGSVESVGTGGHIIGGLMANQVDFDPTTLTGNSLAQFSSCAITRALNGTSRVTPISRDWSQLYGVN